MVYSEHDKGIENVLLGALDSLGWQFSILVLALEDGNVKFSMVGTLTGFLG